MVFAPCVGKKNKKTHCPRASRIAPAHPGFLPSQQFNKPHRQRDDATNQRPPSSEVHLTSRNASPCVPPRTSPAAVLARMTLPAIASTSTQAAPIATKRARVPRVSTALRHAIELLETGECKTQKAAAARAGISDNHLCKSLANPRIQAFIAQRRARNIARVGLRASYRIGELLEAESEHVALRASERVLETTGDLKIANGSTVNVQVNNNLSPGYVIDLTPADRAGHD